MSDKVLKVLNDRFLSEDFMLKSETAKILYNQTARDLPIIDYHCHINPQEIAEDKKYDNLAQIWLTCGDHYKWRVIRANGYGEEFVTGNASDKEKFNAWAETLPKCIGNPLYVWTHMELKKYFDYNGILNAQTKDLVWDLGIEKLKNLSVRKIIEQSKVETICTTDDPIDDLKWHKIIRNEYKSGNFKTKVLPAFRPDKGLHIEKTGWEDYIKKLGASAGIEIKSFADLCEAYIRRLDYFAEIGCVTADNGFENIVFNRGNAENIFKKMINNNNLSIDEINIYKTELFLFLAREYYKRDLVMQIHFGVSRNNSSRLFKLHGADAGADNIGGFNCIAALSKILDNLDETNELPKTILYSVNPSDNAAIVALIGSFGGNIKGKLQSGAAWWFNDNNTGMREQLNNLANNGVLANFVGMLTDSRSFLSYTRHDYFRRIFCDVIGNYVENGEYANDLNVLKEITHDVCYNNAVGYFGL